MKKILVLTMMVMLVASMSVMASDVTVSGETLFEWYQDMEGIYEGNGDGELVIAAVVDDYNTANLDFDVQAIDNIEIDWATFDPATGAGVDEVSKNTIQLDRAYFTTAIGKYAGLEEMGVSITLNWGFQEWDNAGYSLVTGYEREEVWEAKDKDWGVDLDVGIMDMVHVEWAIMPRTGEEEQMMFGVYGGMDPVFAEVYYSQEGNALDKGIVGLGANFGMDIMPGMYAFDVGLAFAYNMDSDAADGDQYALGFGLANTIMEMVYLNVGFAGNDDTIFNLLWFEAGGSYEDMVGADLGVGMWMHEDAPDVMDEIDFSVWVAVGAAKFRIGYCMVSEDNAAPLVGGKDLYQGLNCPGDADHDPSISTGVVYFSGDLDF